MPISWVLKPLAIASAVAFGALGILGRKYQKARLYFNVTIYLTTLATTSVWGILVTILASATGQRLNINYYVARSFYKICGPLVGIKVIVEGEEHLDRLSTANNGKHQSAVVIANHQSMLDILFLGRVFPERTVIMAKKELKYSPLLGQYMHASGAVFIDRKNRKSSHNTVAQAGEDMKRRGVSLWVFPEGTRSLNPEPTLLPFKKGAFHLAVQAQVPVLCIVCENYNRVFDGRTRFEPGTLRVRILPPISTKGLTVDDVSSLTESTREAMLTALKEISKPVPSAAKTAAAIETSVSKATALERVRSSEKNSVDQRFVASSASDSALSEPTSRDTTEDELDGDAVLLKRPKAE
ncbi:hypothetical protein CcaverHIS002_0302360 [Cutaneotrichosporon cavernicola]|uniref:1-acyl-sn-glycerol-3-phosphate acyltransferase n=1 Tax=Cutaneotrichosporon cavernicola TaxID=279322 RepID=A0AA48IAN4_9TREE|nr:uncharacterized protein CcaverHIS019_0302350 [Cutaneotrichosporon cavernicola]BEI82368.1 hypothetical protein CcaverHIS002_0302360 [Cutaneotrichosporon cavernicola]BEI90165.1 hypothetical protein CcaverHIS019_0302350 [Cutaneotrichosporon cavernicola]BEI97943.1 hypothetical protein CcaverHIS631_0302420 [Cutaneotrichosporon cavernicola]BEJ05721.1 hypothetical protein CcaverHIS641_0302430 [Cutaneotrichosporon cavernicola]